MSVGGVGPYMAKCQIDTGDSAGNTECTCAVSGRKKRKPSRSVSGETDVPSDPLKALVSYQPQEADHSSNFLGMLRREGYHNLQRSATPLLPANGVCPLALHTAHRGCLLSHVVAIRFYC